MLTYDVKQVTSVHRWLRPAVLFVFILMISRTDAWITVLNKGQGKVAYGKGQITRLPLKSFLVHT